MLLAPVHPGASPCAHCTSGDTPADSDRTAPQKGARRGLGRQTENNHRHEALVFCFVFFGGVGVALIPFHICRLPVGTP